MNATSPPLSDSPSLDALRARLIDEVLLLFAILITPGVLISISRAFQFGWQPFMNVHLMAMALVSGSWLARRRLGYGIKIWTLLTLLFVGTFSAMTFLGPTADGKVFPILAAILAMLFLPARTAWGVIALFALAFILFGFASVQRWLAFDFDYQAYSHHPLAWALSTWVIVGYSTAVAWVGARLIQGLRDGEQRFKALFDLLPVSIVIHSPKSGAVLDANPETIRRYGCRDLEDFLTGEIWADPPYSEAEAMDLIRRAAAGTPQRFEWYSRDRNGKGFWEDVLLRRTDLGVEDVLLVAAMDITARKQAEHRQALNERRLDALLALSRQAPLMTEEEIFLTGLEDAEALTDSTIAYLHFLDEDQETIRLGYWSKATVERCGTEQGHYPVSSAGIWADAIRQRRPQIHNDYPATPNLRGSPEGHVPIARHMGAPVVDGGKVRMVLGVGNKPTPYDDADLRQLQLIAEDLWQIVSSRNTELALEQARREAESANLAKSAFLANMSHELRTPLNAIMGFAQILEADPALSAGQRTQALNIHRGGEYLLNLINDILDLAKIEAGRIELTPEPWETQPFFREFERMFDLQARQKGLAFRFHPSATLPAALRSDPKRLRQILVNLVGNAFKFTARGEVALTVEFQWGRLRLEVADTGIGIAPEELEQIFKPFHQSGEARYKSQGTGLGLAISRRLTEAMGGLLSAESTPGKGSRFIVEIPAEAVAAPEQTAAEGEAAAPVTGYRRTQGSGPLRILAVDDVRLNRLLLRGLLEPLGFLVEEAENGRICLEAVRRNPPDAILMDLRMPEMNGLEAARILREERFELPIVVLSAAAYGEDRAASLDAGCNAHLSKPVQLEEMTRALGELLPLVWERSPPGPETT